MDYPTVLRTYTTLALVCRRWRDLLRASGPLAIRAKSRLQLQRLGAARTMAIGELEVEGQERGAAGKKGMQQAVERLLEAEAFRQTSGPTLRRLCGIESSAIPARFLARSAPYYPNLQCLDGVWGVPRSGMPTGITQLGLLDTMHYVGYDMVDIGAAFEPLQKLQVLSLRGVSADLLQLPASLQVLLVCDCRLRNIEESRLVNQGLRAGRYDVYMAAGSGGGTVRLLMHFFNGFPASWEQFY